MKRRARRRRDLGEYHIQSYPIDEILACRGLGSPTRPLCVDPGGKRCPPGRDVIAIVGLQLRRKRSRIFFGNSRVRGEGGKGLIRGVVRMPRSWGVGFTGVTPNSTEPIPTIGLGVHRDAVFVGEMEGGNRC